MDAHLFPTGQNFQVAPRITKCQQIDGLRTCGSRGGAGELIKRGESKRARGQWKLPESYKDWWGRMCLLNLQRPTECIVPLAPNLDGGLCETKSLCGVSEWVSGEKGAALMCTDINVGYEKAPFRCLLHCCLSAACTLHVQGLVFLFCRANKRKLSVTETRHQRRHSLKPRLTF